jgi:hypothetical protein
MHDPPPQFPANPKLLNPEPETLTQTPVRPAERVCVWNVTYVYKCVLVRRHVCVQVCVCGTMRMCTSAARIYSHVLSSKVHTLPLDERAVRLSKVK